MLAIFGFIAAIGSYFKIDKLINLAEESNELMRRALAPRSKDTSASQPKTPTDPPPNALY